MGGGKRPESSPGQSARHCRFLRRSACWLALYLLSGGAAIAAPAVSAPPAWIPGYRVRYTIRVEGDLVRNSAQTVMANLPTGGWLKPDASDLELRTTSGQPVPVIVLGHDPLGDTVIQFKRNGNDVYYYAFASNPSAPPRDLASAQRVEALKKAAQDAVLAKMALSKTYAHKAGEYRDIKAQVDAQEAFLKGTNTELAAWEKLVPERTTAAKVAAEKVPPAKAAAEKATATLVPYQKTADEKTAIATPLLRDAAEALRMAQQAAQTLAVATKGAKDAVVAISKAEADAKSLEASAIKSESEAKRTAATIPAAEEAVRIADQEAKQYEGEATKANSAVAGAKPAEVARLKRIAADKTRDAASARQSANARVRFLAQARALLVKRNQAAAQARTASNNAPNVIAAAKQTAETAAKNMKTAETAKGEADKVYAAKDVPAKKADGEAQAARLAAAPFVAAKQKADAEFAALTAASNAANASMKEANDRVAELRKTKQQTEAKLAVSVPQRDAAKKVMDDSKRASDNATADASAKDAAYVGQAQAFDPRAFKEGLAVEYREWAGDKLSSWPAVVAGLQRSDNVLGTAIMGEVVQNVNPYRRSDPRNFAASYRGYLKVETPGVYSFFINADDASFLFINGYKVYSRTGTNPPLAGRVQLFSIGADIQLEAGVHPFEVHHVVGNTPDAKGVCSLLWLTPGSKQWQFVPRTAFTASLLGVCQDVAAFDDKPLSVFEFGMDDALTADGTSIYLARLEPSGKLPPDGSLLWDFGDKSKGTGRPGMHLFFREGDFTVALQSHPAIPAYRRRCHVYTPANSTSPTSLGTAVAVMGNVDFSTLESSQLNDLFHFLLICEQSTRWPVLERLSRHLLKQKDLDAKYRVLLYTSLMESLAQQGRGDEALQLAPEALQSAGKLQTLRTRVQLATGHINGEYLKEYKEADKIYAQIIQDCSRLRHRLVREAAIAWGDMFIEAGNLSRAGDAFRLAKTLGAVGLMTEGQNDAVTRGALLRVAEQQLREGNVRQTRRMLQRIESEFPDQKLEGLYRYLRGESRRTSGRYELSIRDFEVLLQLRQWAGYRPNALLGIADDYYRLGDLQKATDWLGEIKDYPDFWKTRQLDSYEKNLQKRIAKQPGVVKSADGRALVKSFSTAGISFEPEEKLPPNPWKIAPSQGMSGGHTMQGSGAFQLPPLWLQNLPPQGSLWIEVWYRTHNAYPAANASAFVIVAASQNEVGTAVGEGTLYPAGTHDQWQKATFHLVIPPTQNGFVVIHGYSNLGWVEFDGFRVTHISDAQEDSLRNFIEGADPQ